ncbi:malignant fibrous histiocytoma-amplified sequence 1 homolog [Bombina bombina]|uniref:malignant fibrous histiocytoma-amplified sequence 1 homolog n=1 Tax=Bombina bombina TaxID=8345 RepID=UPI00235B1EDF|nr:malignant fibrous histiocytoma-amplified sequence 1 homolog [Bombina bombina]
MNGHNLTTPGFLKHAHISVIYYYGLTISHVTHPASVSETKRHAGIPKRKCNKVMLPLREVNLSLRRLKVIPLDEINYTKIESLNLDRNKLKSVPELSRLQDLKILILSKNELSHFPEEIQLLKHLERLEVNQNKIQNIPNGLFSHIIRLKYLKLNNNRLTELPNDLSSCSNLLYLNLSHNLFSTFPQAVLSLKKLEEFYVENNKLQKLPSELFLDLSLKKFKASSNQLREPPDEVCIGGLKQICSYFFQLQESQAQEVRRVKTMFIGSSMAGKTTLCRSLSQACANPVPREERTVGIEISEFQIEDFTFLFWDFAGHLEYYITHHVFFTPHSLVILVVDLFRYQLNNDDSFKNLVGFWINNLLMRVPDSVVLIVATHIDQCLPEELQKKSKDIQERISRMLKQRKADLSHFINNLEDRQDSEMYMEQAERLREIFTCTLHVLEIIPINSTIYQDIESLQSSILSVVRNVDLFPNIVKMLPPVYKEVEKSITEIMHNHDLPKHGIMELDLLLREVMLKTQDGHLNKDLLKDILRYLHHIGLIVWYEDIQPLLSTVFLKPTFLITMFKMLIRHDLSDQIGRIPAEVLVSEKAFKRDVLKWQEMLRSKAMLRLQAIRVLIKHHLEVFSPCDAIDIFQDMVGYRQDGGKLFSLLEHFQVCFPVRNIRKLNPKASEFVPGGQWPFKKTLGDVFYLFPTYLNKVLEVTERWGGDHHEDLQIRVYFSPEIPEGLFQRLMVKSCSFYTTHWVEKSTFLLVSNGKPLLIRENNQKANSYIELCSRRPHKQSDFRPLWDFILAILSIVVKLYEEWPGLHTYIRTPCRTVGCPDEFEWPDMEGSCSVYDMIKEDFKTCETCCFTINTELLLPKAPSQIKDPPDMQNIHITNYGEASIISQVTSVE